jgi:hypothetical protein
MRTLALLVPLLLSGCFVSLPSKGTAETRQYHGKVLALTTDLDLANTFSRLAAWKHPAEGLGSNQRIVRTVPEGSLIRVTGSTATRCPWGDTYCAACVDVASGTRFDLWEQDLKHYTRTATESENEQIVRGNRR